MYSVWSITSSSDEIEEDQIVTIQALVTPTLELKEAIVLATPTVSVEIVEPVALVIPSPPTPSFVSFEKNHDFMMGFYTPDFPPERNLRSWEELMSVNFELVAWYQHWDQPADSNKLKYTCEMDKIPVITWESWNGRSELSQNGNPYPLWDIADGKFDDLIIEQLLAMKSTVEEFGCSEIWIRFDHEMNTPTGNVSWYPWQGNPDDYVAAWQHVVDLSRELDFHQVKWIYGPAWGNEDAILYYPGSNYVDFIGFTKNQFWRDQFDLRFDKWEFRSFEELYQADIALEDWGKPIVIIESATGEGPEPDSKFIWIIEALEYVESNEAIIAFVWYNADHAREFDDIIFRVDSSEASLRAFSEFFND